jgi:hypothetical protein
MTDWACHLSISTALLKPPAFPVRVHSIRLFNHETGASFDEIEMFVLVDTPR